MKKFANAKVNLALNVTGINEKGYHDLDMIMAPVSLGDIVEIVPSRTDHVEFAGMDVPENNTVTKALEVMHDTFPHISNYSVRIEKRVPEQAGLAGGSADAAAVIDAIDQMEGLALSMERKIGLGVLVGADVPFCLVNETARVQGIGEKIRPLGTDWSFPVLLVKPKQGVSTPQAFRKWDEGCRTQLDVDRVEQAIRDQDMEALKAAMVNALEEPAKQLVPEIEEAIGKMRQAGISRVMMTGSGSALMGFDKLDVLKKAAERLHDEFAFVQIVQAGSGG